MREQLICSLSPPGIKACQHHITLRHTLTHTHACTRPTAASRSYATSVFQSVLPIRSSQPHHNGLCFTNQGKRRDVHPSPSKTQEPCQCFSVSASDSQPFGVGGSREEKKKAGKCLPLFAGTESVRAWVGRVAERAKQAPGMRSVGVRMGGEGEGRG